VKDHTKVRVDGVTVRLVLELMLNAGTKVVPSCAGIVSEVSE